MVYFCHDINAQWCSILMIMGGISALLLILTVIFIKAYQFILHYNAKAHSYKYILLTLSIQLIECLCMCFKYFFAGNYDNIFYLIVLSLITIIATSIYFFFYVELLKITQRPHQAKILRLIVLILNGFYIAIILDKLISDNSFRNTGKINFQDISFILISINGLLISFFLIAFTSKINIEFKAYYGNSSYDEKKIRKLW